MPDFNVLLDTIKDDLIKVAKDFGEDISTEIVQDGKAFARETRQDLVEWSRQAATGELTEADLKWLVRGRKDLAEMEALKQKGIAKAKIDEYRNTLVETIAGSVANLAH